jgi:predicted esterase
MLKSTNITIPTNIQYHLRGDLNSSTVFLGLHGVLEKGSKMLRRLSEVLPEDALMLTPDGPFPIPIKEENGYKVRYAWYFYDNIKDIYVVDYEYASRLIKELLISLKLENKDLVIIGYSQGGYLAPFVAEKCSQTTYIIGLACVFKENLLSKRLTLPFSQVHSRIDKMVSFQGSHDHFNIISKYNNSGEFISLENEGHFYNDKYSEILSNILIQKKLIPTTS